jgi:tetratricopeptide (TPR) repeat protein
MKALMALVVVFCLLAGGTAFSEGGQAPDPWERILGPVGICDDQPCDARCKYDTLAVIQCDAQKQAERDRPTDATIQRMADEYLAQARASIAKALPPELDVAVSDWIMMSARAKRAHNRGVAMAREAKWQDASQQFAEAVRLDGSLPEARYGMALALTRLRMIDEAKLHLDEAVRLRPGYLQASALLSRVNAAIARRAAP